MKRKSSRCSTGHGTGLLVMKAPSWTAKLKQAARLRKKIARQRARLMAVKDVVIE